MNSDSTWPTVDEDRDEVPPITQAQMDRAVYRVHLKPMPRKQKISITLDPDVVAFFKAQAGERGYQTLINAALREAMQHRTLETLLRQVIREELHSA
ncbi:MAG: BrnA antitoxin family protein [Candidatus Competibacter sp.]|nr:BrnA antitoxin family protein [Candidatus Competibacter sp.]